jgi:hypothetical protein
MVSFTPLLLYPIQIARYDHWIGGWVGPKAVVDAVGKRQILAFGAQRQPTNAIRAFTLF